MKISAILFLLALPIFARAQFSKRQAYLGGSLSIGSATGTLGPTPSPLNFEPTKGTSVSLAPAVGWFVNEKTLVGGGVGYTYSYQEYDYQPAMSGFQKNRSEAFSASLYARHYIPVSGSFYFATQGGIYFSRANSTAINNNGVAETTTESPYYSVGITFKPMLVFFPSPKWGVEASVGTLGYSYKRYLPDAYSTSSFAFNAGSFSLGLGYYFGRTEK